MTKKTIRLVLALGLLLVWLGGCEGPQKTGDDMKKPGAGVLETTLGKFAEFYQLETVNVEAFALVGNLHGTGSSECEPEVRAKLVKYIMKQLKTNNPKEANVLIKSLNTAVVYIRGVIPPIALKGDTFDLQVFPLAGTQTSSLQGGRLFTSNLTQSADAGYSKTIALGSGPIFVNKVSGGGGQADGYFVLGGGKVLYDAAVSLVLNEANYYSANAVRNRVNERFGPGIANAVSAVEVRLAIPPKYKNNKDKFLNMISQLYLGTNPRLMQKRIDKLVKNIEKKEDKTPSEIALESIGNACLPSVAPLLESQDEAIRFHAARCMLNMDDSRGLDELRKILRDRKSEYRVAAVHAIGEGADRNDTVRSLNTVLNDDNYDVRFAAYENMRDLNVFAISRKMIGGNFVLETVAIPGTRSVYVTRTGTPKIVLFAVPLDCSEEVFAKSEDGSVVVNGESGKKFISIMRKHPTQPTLIGPFLSSYSVADVIRTLGEQTIQSENSSVRPGLGVPYSEIIMILERMCSDKMIDARFDAGPAATVIPINQPNPAGAEPN